MRSRVVVILLLAGLVVTAGGTFYFLRAERSAPSACAAAGPDQQSLMNSEAGYCLLYPAEYTLVQPQAGSVELVAGSVMNHTEPRLSVEVSGAAGQTLEEAVAQVEADYVPDGWDAAHLPIVVDGVEGIAFDNLPGQDLNRRVVFVHDGKLFTLFLAPLGDEGTETRAQAEELYRQVLDSFRFLDAG